MLVITFIHASIQFAFKEISHALIMLHAKIELNKLNQKKISFASFGRKEAWSGSLDLYQLDDCVLLNCCADV